MGGSIAFCLERIARTQLDQSQVPQHIGDHSKNAVSRGRNIGHRLACDS